MLPRLLRARHQLLKTLQRPTLMAFHTLGLGGARQVPMGDGAEHLDLPLAVKVASTPLRRCTSGRGVALVISIRARGGHSLAGWTPASPSGCEALFAGVTRKSTSFPRRS